MYLFLDTETDSANPKDAEVVQVAYILTLNDGYILELGSFLIRTVRQIPDGAYNVHGISNEIADTYGVGMKTFFSLINRHFSLKQNIQIVCHNAAYDTTILLRLLKQLSQIITLPEKDSIEKALKNPICTMKIATPICCIPGRNGFKWPKLSEAYEYFLAKPLLNAHNAFYDTLVCKEIFFKLQELGLINASPTENSDHD